MKIKSQKGSITIFVLIALLFYTAFLLLMYAANTNKLVAIKEKSDILKGIYEKNTSEESINNLYSKKTAEYNSDLRNFQKVEYLESTGTQYIDTLMKLNQDSAIELDIQMNNEDNYNIFGSRTNSTTNSFIIFMWKSDNSFVVDFQSYASNRLKTTLHLDRTIIKISKYNLSIGSNIKSVNNYTNFETPTNAHIFNISNSAPMGKKAIMKMYECKIYDNDVLVRNFIPCYRKSDNKPGLYDTVNNQFYTNQGTGDDFIVGPDVD